MWPTFYIISIYEMIGSKAIKVNGSNDITTDKEEAFELADSLMMDYGCFGHLLNQWEQVDGTKYKKSTMKAYDEKEFVVEIDVKHELGFEGKIYFVTSEELND